jgi:hypothetical protein
MREFRVQQPMGLSARGIEQTNLDTKILRGEPFDQHF